MTYYEYHDLACKKHKISDINIYYNVENLEINYVFYKKDKYLLLELLKTDINNAVYFKKIYFNGGGGINYTQNFDDTENCNYSVSFETNNKKNNEIDYEDINIVSVMFSKNEEDIENIISEYIWFMRLVRCEIFKYHENDYYIDKEIKRRKDCYTYEEIDKILRSIHIVNK